MEENQEKDIMPNLEVAKLLLDEWKFRQKHCKFGVFVHSNVENTKKISKKFWEKWISKYFLDSDKVNFHEKNSFSSIFARKTFQGM